MKNKIIIIGLIIGLTFGITGCGKNTSLFESPYANMYVGKTGTFEWISPDGVHYWVYNGTQRYGITPRYSSNGNLIIDN